MKDSRSTILNNEIYENQGIGIFIRDKSTGIVSDNKVLRNAITLFVERKCESLKNIR